MLCNDKFAVNNPFEYQKAGRLVYCNLLEHLLLHVKIAENPSPDANENELPGIGGAINFICKDLNDIYSGKEFTSNRYCLIFTLLRFYFWTAIMVIF